MEQRLSKVTQLLTIVVCLHYLIHDLFIYFAHKLGCLLSRLGLGDYLTLYCF